MYIAEFLMEPPTKFADWVNPEKVWNGRLCANPKALYLIKRLEIIDWYYLSENPAAIEILEKNQKKIVWKNLSKNPKAEKLLRKNIKNADSENVSATPELRKLLDDYPNLISFETICSNSAAIDIINKNWDLVSDRCGYSKNPALADFLKKNKMEICYTCIYKNPNPDIFLKYLNGITFFPDEISANPTAVGFLKTHTHAINWKYLSRNPAAGELLKQNPENLDYRLLSSNPAIIENDPEKHKEQLKILGGAIYKLLISVAAFSK